MLRAFERTSESIRLLAMLALSVLLMCVLLPHHSHAQAATGAGSGSTAVPTAAAAPTPSADTPASSAPDTKAQSPSTQEGDDHGTSPGPVCHNAGTQVMDMAKRFTSGQSDVLGFLGALLITFVGVVSLGTRARARWWSARPPRALAGFLLLLTLGVSRT